jgi:hypothetical protein
MTKVRPATRADVEKFLGTAQPFSCRAVAVEKDGVCVGVGGVYWDNGVYIAFSHIEACLRSDKRTILKACKQVMKIIKDMGICVQAIPDPDEQSSEAFISHFGFQKQGEVFVWR